MSESKIQSKLIKQLESEGCYVIKLSVTNKTGIPDLICIRPSGIAEFYEVKQPGKQPRELQKYRMKELSKYVKCFVHDGETKLFKEE